MRQLIVLLLCVFAVPLAAQRIRIEMLVSPEWLASHLDRVTIIEIGDGSAYKTAHLPGARLVETTKLLTPRNGTPNELPSIQALEAVLTRAGVGDRGRIILYGRDPLLSARAWFTLDYLGHGQRAAILDGGFTRGVAHRRSPHEPRRSPADILARADPPTTEGHSRRNDFSRWIGEVYGDHQLAARVRDCEERHRLQILPEVNGAIVAAIRERYATPETAAA